MAEIGHEHLHHMAKRLHHANMRFENIRTRISGIANRFADTAVVAGSAWGGGVLEGVTNGGTIPLVNIPWNLGLGILFTAVSHIPQVTGHSVRMSNQLGNIGSGLLSSYTSAVGYHWGKGWKDSGFKLWGRKSLSQPYQGLGAGDVIAGQQLNDAQLYDIMQNMRAAAQGAGPGR